MKNTKLPLVLAGMLTLSTASFADDKADIAELKQQVKELQEMSQALVDETSDLKTGFNYTVVDDSKSYSGLGAAASKVYYSKSPLSIGGYGEMYYANTTKDGTTSSVIDVYRFVPYIGYKFSDNIILNTEIEFEHGGSKQSSNADLSGGYVIMEFMYLDFLFNDNLNARIGNMLLPMGLVNERHEPTLFTTVQRPSTEKYLIPSTWSENGIMAYGNIIDGLVYKAGIFTSLNTDTDTKSWIRNGRAGTLKQKNPNIAYTARVDYTGLTGLLLGASVYGQDNLLMTDVHADYKVNGLRVYGLYTQTTRSNATDFNATTAPESAQGGYVNLSYDVLATTNSKYSLPVFVQYENVNTTATAAGTAPVTTSAVGTTTVGLNFFPHEQVVLKVDYAMADNQYGTKSTDEKISSETLSVSMGFIF